MDQRADGIQRIEKEMRTNVRLERRQLSLQRLLPRPLLIELADRNGHPQYLIDKCTKPENQRKHDSELIDRPERRPEVTIGQIADGEKDQVRDETSGDGARQDR